MLYFEDVVLKRIHCSAQMIAGYYYDQCARGNSKTIPGPVKVG